MFKKSLVAIAVLGATAFSAQAFTLPYGNTTDNFVGHALGQRVNQNFAAVQDELNAHAGQISQNTNKNNTQDNLIKGNTEAIKANGEKITANANDIAANKTQISQNTNDIHGLQQKVVENQMHDVAQDQNIAVNKNNIGKNKQEIAANKTQISQNTNDIHGLQQKVVENQMHDVAQDQNIAVNKNNIGKNKQEIAANKTQIEKNAQAIKNNYAEMKQNFAAMNTRIDDLDEEMKKGFASQAALAGLFQPYNVGKFNLSVALGGYESEQAMALGTGYRFNENFAMKAGIATDVGGFDHLTYNIGANFEW